MALFKPDMTGNDYLIELNIYQIATFFDIPCSKVMPYTLNSIIGFLSIVEDIPNCHRINCADLYQSITLKSPSLCKIAFLDALCRNQDRYIGNIDFLISPSNKTVAPSYDTVLSLSNSFTESAMLGITSNKTYSHQEIFSYLKILDFMQNTINKLNTKEFKELCNDLEYDDFIYNRAKEFIKLP
ncbi:MAG: hypothetical protein HFE57_14210 [Firmicutes bacterium]|jgi:hypothetical protein|nr:hypothetical protein [Bacillota bacterium]